MSRAGRCLSLSLIAFLAASVSMAQADPPSRSFKGAKEVLLPVARQSLKDAIDLGTAPIHWRGHQWLRFGEGVGVVLAAYAVDNRIVTFASHQQNHVLNFYLTNVTHLGGGYGIDVAAILAGAGFLTRDEQMMDAGIDALESSVAAAGIVTPIGKRLVGRARPIRGLGSHSFNPFNSGFQSFPSGHATNAFAIASAIATRYDDSHWVPAVAYTLATSVAIARVHSRVHFASDVLAGGMIGHAIAKSIVANHRRVHVAFIPTGEGFRVDVRF